ncbi:MAG: OadG family protein [Treponema sp.]|jgi:oxaloacetate decarboxylase gamma subunit|nr:OadG family protein [Treponema sp.]
MTILEMFQQSVILTLLGMAVVFSFLWLMIICVELLGKLIHKLGMDKDVQPKPIQPFKTEAPKNANETINPEITAAITAAVIDYRNKERPYE